VSTGRRLIDVPRTSTSRSASSRGTTWSSKGPWKLEGRIKGLQADYEAVTIAIGRTLDDKVAYVEGTADG
jgi:hypothetical protein